MWYESIQTFYMLRIQQLKGECSKDNTLVLELQPWQPPVTDMDLDWVKEHEKQFGEKPSFF